MSAFPGLQDCSSHPGKIVGVPLWEWGIATLSRGTTQSAESCRGLSQSPTYAWWHHHPKPVTLHPQAFPVNTHLPTAPHLQKFWDQAVVHHQFDSLLAQCTDQSSPVRLLGACSGELGAWLNTPPVSSLGLHMSIDAIRTAIGLRVCAPICLPHTCNLCGKSADTNLDVMA